LRNEGYFTHTITGPMLRAQLKGIIDVAEKSPMEFPYIYRWNRCGRKGHACKVTGRGWVRDDHEPQCAQARDL
jgi:hypothetical protein